MKVFISCDHGGFELKNVLLDYIKELGYEVEDLGPQKLNPDDDFPLFTLPLTKAVLAEYEARGIVVCRNGVGVCVAANKVKGIRCALSWNLTHARSARTDDNTNVLALPADYVAEDIAKGIVKIWLETPFSNEERYKRRLEEVAELEKTS